MLFKCSKNFKWSINPLAPNETFLYPPKTSESMTRLYLCFYMAHGHQTRQTDGLWYWPLYTKSYYSLIYVASWQKKNVISPVPQILWTPSLTGWWLMTWEKHSKNHIALIKKFFPFMNFFPTKNCTFNLTQGHYKITLISKWKGATNINIYKSLCEITWSMVAFDSWNLYIRLANFSFVGFRLASKKDPSVKN